MTESISKVTIILFENAVCPPCKTVEPILRQIVTSSTGSASLTIIDIDKEKDLANKYNINGIPAVYFNDKLVLSAHQAVMLMSGSGSVDENPFSLLNADEKNVGFTDIFGNGQSGLFNHLFNQLISSSIDSNAEMLERRLKFNMLAISQKTMTPEAFQNITRPALGDYVHIGILQSIVTSILAINPRSSEYLYKVGRDMGRFGNVQFQFLRHYPQIYEHFETADKFRVLLDGLQELYSAYSLGFPLFIASRSLINHINEKTAKLTVYDSAYCAQISPIGQPVCYLIAGEIAGLIESTLGEQVSVVETKCFGLGDPFCQFQIELDKERDFSFISERNFLSEPEKERFQQCLLTISKNMYYSSLIRNILRPGLSDHVHISVLQQTLNGIKFSDPFFSTLLFYAGLHYGKYGVDYAIIERIVEEKESIVYPMEFSKSLELLTAFFNDPATILTRWQGNAELEIINNETAYINIYESANASGLNMKSPDFILDVDVETTLCDFTAGFIQGRLSKLSSETIQVTEETCLSVGSEFCRFKITLN